MTNLKSRTGSRKPRLSPFFWISIILLMVIALFIWHVHSSHKKQEEQQDQLPSVRVIKPKPSPKETDITLPGTIQAWQETPIYARANGYLTHWYHDIGDTIHKGDLLADIDTPDIDQQLMQTQGTLRQNEANLEIARITAERWTALVKENAVAKQDADEKVANYKAQQAMVEASRADVKRLSYLQSFKKLYAPFDGVVTERTVDNGALITSGTAGARELFKIAQVDVMRIYVGVPQTEARAIEPGLKTHVILSEFPDRTFTGTVTRSAREIDATARTLLTEVDVPNPDNALLPGMYAQVRLTFPAPEKSLIVPANVIVIHAEEPKIILVGDDNKLRFVSVVIGRDYGQETEIVKGLSADAQMVNNPNDTLVDGEEVKIEEKQPENPKASKQEDEKNRTSGDKNKDASTDKNGKDKNKSDTAKDSGDNDKKEGTAPKKQNDQDKTPPTGTGEGDVKDSNDALPDTYKKKPDQKSGKGDNNNDSPKDGDKKDQGGKDN